ncbi:hypothetical protein BST43_19170 [Mycobacteroides saopaulense]|uniref:PPE family domain-containing protein n=1 Tax=Mycobacteroides saopaulense TaxID=1578165 RepID=A0A1X0IWF1_9MYCO|nr:hypothetical protein [Mycobacteroides saopaulense]ORB52596.1 hypothetical protein BST43_19170 [Mycobacteroides saopaulense]
MTGTVRSDEWHGEKWSHESIMDMQARMAPADITRIAVEWKGHLRELDSLFSTFLEDVTATIDESWSGPGARAALRTMRAYVENSRTALDPALTLSSGLDVLASATRELQQKIASPPASAPVSKLGDLPGWSAPFSEHLSRWEQALNQVQTMYSGPAIAAGNAVAELVGPRERLRFGSGPDASVAAARDRSSDEQAERAEEFLARWGLGAQGQNPQQMVLPGGTAMAPQIPAMTRFAGNALPGKGFGSGSTSESNIDELGEDDVYAGQDWMRDPLWRESPTRSAGFESTATRQPLAPDRMPPLAAGPTATSGGGIGTGAAPRSWGAMMPMMAAYPPHAGQRRGDENEHYCPRYLVNGDNTRELLGELPKGAAPVIGLWDSDPDEDTGPALRRGFRSR